MIKLGKKKDKAPADADDATKLAVAHGAEVEGEAPAKKKLPLLFIIAPVALLVLGGGGAGAFFMLQPKPAAAEGEHGEGAAKGGHGEEKKSGGHGEKKEGGGHGGGGEGGEADPSLGKISEGPDGVTFLTLPDMVVNIQSPDGRPTVMKLGLTLEMHDADLASQLQSEMPRMQDMFQGFLRELRPEDIAGSAGQFQLRAEILRRVNLIAAPSTVDAVLIEEMLVQ
ncbi:flagellar basal body-associated FliL family protein [Brevundimonas sp. NIBR11]|uniref:flagellar basal body-associated FliL family protein n=1 Tax=Brevundimonas sp. NIBR11 TaxID=3015999 RepID=UPI0022F06DE1|nr:flagellar basal body-associated FliL family protein [Brevundimonas sp. NIBR11]WGM31808.1 Flagellar FliL protein [Brevundimonas sp. NIBR11]